VPGSKALGLDNIGQLITERLADKIGAMTQDHREAVWIQLAGGIHDMLHHGSPHKGMHHLG
jgi:hypothetical protein